MKIFVTRQVIGAAIEKLKEVGEVIVSPYDRVLTAQEIIEMGKESDGILTVLTDRWTGEMIDSMGSNLKILSNYAVGFDNIDIKAATERGIIVTNTPSEDVNESVGEFTWALILALSRRMIEADEFAKKGAYKGWEPHSFLGRDVEGKTVGIVGLGRIGTQVAVRARAFQVKILCTESHQDEEKEKSLGAEHRSFEDLLRESDYVTLHVPLTEETRHMINQETLSLMKPTAYLINTARGPVVDEEALVQALREGKIAGAALDVHENEPQMNPELMQMENVILTPHIASATVEVREKMTEQAVDAILKTLSGQKPENLVNPEVWPSARAQAR